MAAINLYDPHSNSFIRNFYEHPIPLEELNELRANLKDYAKALHALRLDTVESALLCCLVVMSSGELFIINKISCRIYLC